MFKILILAAVIVCAAAIGVDIHAKTILEKFSPRKDGSDSVGTNNHNSPVDFGDAQCNIHGYFEWLSPAGKKNYVDINYDFSQTPPIPEAIQKAINYAMSHTCKKDHHHHHH